MNRALDVMEDPGETLDYSYQKQLGLLQEVRRGLAEVATSKQRLKMQAEKLQPAGGHDQASQAQRPLSAGRDDLARVWPSRAVDVRSADRKLEQSGHPTGRAAGEASAGLAAVADPNRDVPHAEGVAEGAVSGVERSGQDQRVVYRLSRRDERLGTSLQRAQDRIETDAGA